MPSRWRACSSRGTCTLSLECGPGVVHQTVFCLTRLQKHYFHNVASGATQWHDPRGLAAPRARKLLSRGDRWRARALIVAPLALFFGAWAARVSYLKKHFPELLHPTKKRKERKQGLSSGRKYRPPGQRRMSQDGKGGRSNNT